MLVRQKLRFLVNLLGVLWYNFIEMRIEVYETNFKMTV